MKITEVAVGYFPLSYKQRKRIHIWNSIDIICRILRNILVGKTTLHTPFGIFLVGLALWLFTFSIYNLHANSSSTSDSLPNNFTAVNILYNNRLDLTNFTPYFQSRHQISVVTKNNDGISYAKTPVINGILSAPFFFFFDQRYGIHDVSADAFLQKDYETYYQAVGKYYAALIASISVFFVFLTVYSLFKNLLYAIFGALSYGFATMVYSTASQGNWQHAPSLLLLSISFYLFFFFLRSNRQSLLVIISLFLSLATLIRISNSFFFISIISILLFYNYSRRLVAYSCIVFLLPMVFWQGISYVIGIPGGYDQEIIQSIQSFNLWYTLQVIVSLLVSPNVGLLIFCPLAVLSFLGAYKILHSILQDKESRAQPVSIFLITSVLSFILIFLFNAFWWAWEGGYSWGPRLLTEAAPFLIFLCVYYFTTLSGKITKPVFSIIFLILFFVSVFIHAVGVYANDNEWHTIYYKQGIDRMTMAWQTHPSVLWYYVIEKKVFFTQKIVAQNNAIKIEKNYYYIDPLKGSFAKIKTCAKLL